MQLQAEPSGQEHAALSALPALLQHVGQHAPVHRRAAAQANVMRFVASHPALSAALTPAAAASIASCFEALQVPLVDHLRVWAAQLPWSPEFAGELLALAPDTPVTSVRGAAAILLLLPAVDDDCWARLAAPLEHMDEQLYADPGVQQLALARAAELLDLAPDGLLPPPAQRALADVLPAVMAFLQRQLFGSQLDLVVDAERLQLGARLVRWGVRLRPSATQPLLSLVLDTATEPREATPERLYAAVHLLAAAPPPPPHSSAHSQAVLGAKLRRPDGLPSNSWGRIVSSVR